MFKGAILCGNSKDARLKVFGFCMLVCHFASLRHGCLALLLNLMPVSVKAEYEDAFVADVQSTLLAPSAPSGLPLPTLRSRRAGGYVAVLVFTIFSVGVIRGRRCGLAQGPYHLHGAGRCGNVANSRSAMCCCELPDVCPDFGWPVVCPDSGLSQLSARPSGWPVVCPDSGL